MAAVDLPHRFRLNSGIQTGYDDDRLNNNDLDPTIPLSEVGHHPLLSNWSDMQALVLDKCFEVNTGVHERAITYLRGSVGDNHKSTRNI